MGIQGLDDSSKQLLGLLLSFASVLTVKLVSQLLYRIWPPKEQKKQVSYYEKLSQLTNSLTKASAEVDNVLGELSQVAHDRQAEIVRLEGVLRNLEVREKDLQKRVQDLENVPINVAEHFSKLLVPVERKSTRRDYVLFVAGAVLTTVISLLLKHL